MAVVVRDRPLRITPTESKILDTLIEGRETTTKEIAGRLGMNPHTVRTHIQNLLAKTQLHSKVALAVWWARRESQVEEVAK